MFTRAYALLTITFMLAGATCNDSPTPNVAPQLRPADAPEIASLITASETKLLAPSGIASDLFGFSVALSDTVLAVGTPYEDSAAMDAGAVYIFAKTNNGWIFEQKLVAPDFGSGKWFGYSVAVTDDKLVVGSPKADGKSLNAGVAYVFTRNIQAWTVLPQIAAADGRAGDMFGQAVDIAGDSIVVGCPRSDTKGAEAGAAYVFAWNGTTYIEQKKILSTDSKAGDHFGSAVAMHRETVIIGAPDANVYGPSSGAAYTFFRQGTLWSQQKKLVSPNGAAGDGFGWAVDVEFDTAIVGAPMDDMTSVNAGAVYSFERTGVSWNLLGDMAPLGLAADDRFGSSVALSGKNAVIGALLDDSAEANAGAAYAFARNGASWSQEIEVLASDAAAGDAFGFAVAISGQTVVSGAYLNDEQGTSAGATYVYELKNEGGETCSTAAECLSGFCVDGICCDSVCDFGICAACTVAAGASADGVCTLLDGANCDDGDACTQTDTCLAGQCIGGNPKTCSPLDICTSAATCDPATGMCVAGVTPNGTQCDDGNACTTEDVCQTGVCQGLGSVSCLAQDACHAAGTCDPTNGVCSKPVLPDGTVCPSGTCQNGECVPPFEPVLVTGGGCDCRVNSKDSPPSTPWSIGSFLGLWAASRARKRSLRRPSERLN